jgi:signal transduction histidine kinase
VALGESGRFTRSLEVRGTDPAADGEMVSGAGTPAERHEQIFEEVYQAPGSARSGDTGPGLPYARRSVNLPGGSLEFASEPGRGSIFTVTLPVSGG